MEHVCEKIRDYLWKPLWQCITLVFLVHFYTEANAGQHMAQQRRLNVFHIRSPWKLLGISWKSRISNTVGLSRCGLLTMFMMLRQLRLRWLGHVRRMKDGRIPKDILYGELIAGKRNLGRPQLHNRKVCKRDMKELSIDENKWWEELATDRSKWKSYLQATLKVGEKNIITALENKCRLKKENLKTANLVVDNTVTNGVHP